MNTKKIASNFDEDIFEYVSEDSKKIIVLFFWYSATTAAVADPTKNLEASVTGLICAPSHNINAGFRKSR